MLITHTSITHLIIAQDDIVRILAPSGILTEAFFKSRVLLSPVFFHNEAAVKYQNISKIFSTSNDIKINILRVA